MLSGEVEARVCAEKLGIEFELCKKDGDELSHGERFANLLASSKQIALAEEQLIGTFAKASGIATASRTAVHLADGKVKIVSGSWKKMPPETKRLVRHATAVGGASFGSAATDDLFGQKLHPDARFDSGGSGSVRII